MALLLGTAFDLHDAVIENGCVARRSSGAVSLFGGGDVPAGKAYPTQVLVAPFLGLLAAVAVYRAIMFSMERSFIQSPHPWIKLITGLIPFALLVVGVALVVARTVEKAEWRELARRIGFDRLDQFTLFIGGGIALAGLLISVLYFMLAGANCAVVRRPGVTFAWVLACMVLPAEVVFRGVIFRLIRQGRPFRTAVVATGVLAVLPGIPLWLAGQGRTPHYLLWLTMFFIVAPFLWTLPMSLIYDRGKQAFWSACLVAFGSHAGRMVTGSAIPDATPNWWFRNGWLVLGIVLPFLFSGFIWLVMSGQWNDLKVSAPVAEPGKVKT